MAWHDEMSPPLARLDVEDEQEARLAAQVRAGADWALAALVARYQPRITRYLTRLTGSSVKSRELAETVFVRMERRIRGPQGARNLRLWLLRASTEAGLDALRPPPARHSAQRLEGPRLAGLLAAAESDSASGRMRAGLTVLANLAGSTSRQVRKLIWAEEPEPRNAATATSSAATSAEMDAFEQNSRMALRFRIVRAILVDLPYGDAQCIALHLIAGLNQAEVAQALGITNSATRKRIVHGLQLFTQRYEATTASLGLPSELRLATQYAGAGGSIAENANPWAPYLEAEEPAHPGMKLPEQDPSAWTISSTLPPAPAFEDVPPPMAPRPTAPLMASRPTTPLMVDAIPVAPVIVESTLASEPEPIETGEDSPQVMEEYEADAGAGATEQTVTDLDAQVVETSEPDAVDAVESVSEIADEDVTAMPSLAGWQEPVTTPDPADPEPGDTRLSAIPLVPVLTVNSVAHTMPAVVTSADSEAKPSSEDTATPRAVRVVPVLTPAEPVSTDSMMLVDGHLLEQHENHEVHEIRHNGVRIVPVLTAHVSQTVGQ